MTTETQSEPKTPKRTQPKRQTCLKKIDLETSKLLGQLRDRANKKPYGRKVRDAELIAAGLRLLGEPQITELQDQTLSEQDRLRMAHEDFQKTNGKISLDQFIGRLIRGEIQISKK
ncbi:MAG: hypothetical protein J0L82_10080 [Deltaproteobacteria bacterium]|jgi:hypothetical protein|nr:hypothetical protein [Deltaproteobacteria bacterium]